MIKGARGAGLGQAKRGGSQSARIVALKPERQVLVRVQLIGAMRAVSYLGADVLPRGRKARALLVYLSLARGEPVPRARLAALLWDRVGEAQARASLRQALHELGGSLGDLADDLLVIDKQSARIDPQACWVDAAALSDSVATDAGAELTDISQLLSGQYLEGLDGLSAAFDQWLLAERSRFADVLRDANDRELSRVNDAPSDQRIAVARRIVALDPTHEGAARVLMRALVEEGDRPQAMREFERHANALKLMLDITPSRETMALLAAIRTYPAESPRRPPATVTLPPRASAHPQQPAAASRRNRLRVAMAPFVALDDRVPVHLPLAIAQETAAALARFRWFDVIAPVSLRKLRESDADWGALAVQLDLDYLVDARIGLDGDELGVSVSLLEVAGSIRSVWSDKLTLSLSSASRFPEIVVAPLVARIDPIILFMEGRHRSGRNLTDATGYLLEAIPLMYGLEREGYERAGRLLEQALAAEPDNPVIPAWCAFWWMFRIGQGWTDAVTEALQQAEAMCLLAIRLDPTNAQAVGIYAHLCAFYHHDFDNALHYFDLSQRLNPNLAFVWALSAATYCYIGDPDAALARLRRYRNLAPFDPYYGLFESLYTMAYTFKGDYDQAATIGRRAVRSHPDFVNGYKPLIAALGHLGRREEAAFYIRELRSREPSFSVRGFLQSYPIKRSADRARYAEGLRRAGVPETSSPEEDPHHDLGR
jgi:DNA-binding SARP family transcriptional activator